MCDPADSNQLKCWLLTSEDIDLCRGRANRLARNFLAVTAPPPVLQQDGETSTSATASAAALTGPSDKSFAKNFASKKKVYAAENDGPWETSKGDPFLNPEEEQMLVSFYAAKIPSLIGPSAQHPPLRREAKFPATAAMLFRRFFLSNSVMIHDPKVVMTSAAWMASKVEDLMCGLSHLEEATNLMNSPVTKTEIIPAEVHLLAGVDFDLLCFHSYKAVLAMTEDMRSHLKSREAQKLVTFPSGTDRVISGMDLKPMYEAAVAIVNDVIVSDLPLLYTPSQIGLAALMLANEKQKESQYNAEGGGDPQDLPQIDFLGYLEYRFEGADVQVMSSLLGEIRQKLQGLKEGKHGCGNYNMDLQMLKGVHKKLKKCRMWGQRDKSKPKTKKKRKSNDGEEEAPTSKKAKKE